MYIDYGEGAYPTNYMGIYDADLGEYRYPSKPQNLVISFTPDSPETPFYLSALDGDISADGVTITSEIGSSEDTTIGNASAKVLTASMLNPQGTMDSLDWGYGAVYIGFQSYSTTADSGGTGYPVGIHVDGTALSFRLKPNGDAYLSPSATTYTLGGDPIAVIANHDGTDVLFITATKIGRYLNGSFSVVTTPTASQDYLAKKYRDFPTTIGVMLNANGCPVKYNCEETNTCQSYSYVPMGTFDFSNVDARGLAFTAEAYDKMTLFDADATSWINGLDFTTPKTVSDLINELVVALGFTASLDANAVNLSFSYSANPFSGYTVTYRQVLKWLAEMIGCNARMGRTDVVEFFAYINVAYVTVMPDVIISGSRTTARYTTPNVDEIVCYDITGTPYSSGAGSGVYYIVSNPLFQGLDQDVSILTAITSLFASGGSAWWGYRPTTISIAYSYPGIDVGDTMSLYATDGSSMFVPIMRQTMHWSGVCKATLTATGKQQRTIPDGEITSLTGSVGNNNPVAATQGHFGGVSVASADYPDETIDIFPDSITLEDATHTKTITADGPTAVTGSGTTSIASGSYKTLGSIDFPRGVYLIMVNARFPSDATGRREVLLSASQDSGSAPTEFYLDYRNAVNGNYTNCKFTTVRSFSGASTTMYINAYQNSGNAQAVFYRWFYMRLV